LVQETFLEAQRDFGHFQGGSESDLLRWLGGILHNNLANFRRRYRQTEMREVRREVPLEGDPHAENLLAAVADHILTPSGFAIAEEQAQPLQQGRERPPAPSPRVVLPRQREQLSFEEIGRRLGRPTEAVRKLWVRAIAQLHKELDAP